MSTCCEELVQCFGELDPKHVAEKWPLTFDFTADLAAEDVTPGTLLTGTPTVTVTVALDSLTQDANPMAILNGAAGFDATMKKVVVPIQEGVPYCKYRIEVDCSTTQANFAPTLVGYLTVIP